jgi:hypothetical protein
MDERFLEWAPREQGGGGLRGIYTKQEAGPRLARCRIDGPRRITSEGNTIDRTLQMHVLNLASFGSRCVVPFSRSGFRIGDQWLHNINKIKVTKPTGGWTGVRPWYKVWFLNVAERSNAKGTWLVFRPEEGPVFGKIGNEEPFMPDWQDYRKEAKEYEQAILRGEVQADYSSMDEGEAGEYGGGSATEDDNAPM